MRVLDAGLVAVFVLATAIWVGGLVTIAVIAQVARARISSPQIMATPINRTRRALPPPNGAPAIAAVSSARTWRRTASTSPSPTTTNTSAITTSSGDAATLNCPPASMTRAGPVASSPPEPPQTAKPTGKLTRGWAPRASTTTTTTPAATAATRTAKHSTSSNRRRTTPPLRAGFEATTPSTRPRRTDLSRTEKRYGDSPVASEAAPQ